MDERIAKINRADLGFEDHGIFGFNIDFQFSEASFQGTGWYGIKSSEILSRVMEAVGVARWEDLRGRTVLALYEDERIVGIKPLPTENGKILLFKNVEM